MRHDTHILGASCADPPAELQRQRQELLVATTSPHHPFAHEPLPTPRISNPFSDFLRHRCVTSGIPFPAGVDHQSLRPVLLASPSHHHTLPTTSTTTSTTSRP